MELLIDTHFEQDSRNYVNARGILLFDPAKLGDDVHIHTFHNYKQALSSARGADISGVVTTTLGGDMPSREFLRRLDDILSPTVPVVLALDNRYLRRDGWTEDTLEYHLTQEEYPSVSIVVDKHQVGHKFYETFLNLIRSTTHDRHTTQPVVLMHPLGSTPKPTRQRNPYGNPSNRWIKVGTGRLEKVF